MVLKYACNLDAHILFNLFTWTTEANFPDQILISQKVKLYWLPIKDFITCFNHMYFIIYKPSFYFAYTYSC